MIRWSEGLRFFGTLYFGSVDYTIFTWYRENGDVILENTKGDSHD